MERNIVNQLLAFWMAMFSLLKKYTELPGPVGNEERVHRAFAEDLKPYAAEVKLSNVGNVIAHFPGERTQSDCFWSW